MPQRQVQYPPGIWLMDTLGHIKQPKVNPAYDPTKTGDWNNLPYDEKAGFFGRLFGDNGRELNDQYRQGLLRVNPQLEVMREQSNLNKGEASQANQFTKDRDFTRHMYDTEAAQNQHQFGTEDMIRKAELQGQENATGTVQRGLLDQLQADNSMARDAANNKFTMQLHQTPGGVSPEQQGLLRAQTLNLNREATVPRVSDGAITYPDGTVRIMPTSQERMMGSMTGQTPSGQIIVAPQDMQRLNSAAPDMTNRPSLLNSAGATGESEQPAFNKIQSKRGLLGDFLGDKTSDGPRASAKPQIQTHASTPSAPQASAVGANTAGGQLPAGQGGVFVPSSQQQQGMMQMQDAEFQKKLMQLLNPNSGYGFPAGY